MKSRLNCIYVPKPLEEKLQRIRTCPLTTIVAPAGYGKSTAIRHFCGGLPPETLILRQSVVSESAADFWKGFAEMFSTISPNLAAALLQLGQPPNDGTTLREFQRLMQENLAGLHEGYVIIDDFHLAMNEDLHRFMGFCASHIPDGVHLVLLSRGPIFRAEDAIPFSGKVNILTAQDLRFRAEDISSYFALCGYPIRRAQAVSLDEISEGWVSVLYLNLKAFADTGRFADAAEIHALMGSVLYRPLPAEQKELLMALCLLPHWTEEQAVAISGNPRAAALLRQMRTGNAFLYYNVADERYKLHHLLQESVKKTFMALPAARRNVYLRRIGLWFLQSREYIYAIQVFYEAREFELLMESVERSLGTPINAEHREMMLAWFRDCPQEILNRHPVAVMVYARRLFTFHMHDDCVRVLEVLRQRVQRDTNMTERMRRNLLGEIEVNESFLHYNDIREMNKHQRRACELLDGPTTSISPDAAWTFGALSVLLCYHREAGALEREVEAMKESMPFWYRLNQSQGIGAEHLMDAERFLNQGALNDAEICVYRALYQCTSEGKLDMQIMAALVRLQLELVRGSFDGVEPTLKRLREEAHVRHRYMLLHTLDLCEGWLYALLDQTPAGCADWLLCGDFNATRIMYPALPAAHVVYNQTLLTRKQYAALIAREDTERAMFRVFPMVLCEIYLDIQLAAAYDAMGKRETAREHLSHALELAMPDRLSLPFVFLGEQIAAPLCALSGGPWHAQILDIRRMAEDYGRRKREILQTCFPSKPVCDLSERERKIAEMAAARLTNQEIAQTLELSENTVKAALRVIYQKLGIAEGGRGKKRALEELLAAPR